MFPHGPLCKVAPLCATSTPQRDYTTRPERIERVVSNINYLDLFSGVGGFHRGLHEAGFRFNWSGHAEVDRHAGSIYRRQFPASEVLGDVRAINPEQLPSLDLITFGFPCQDLSVAGKRRGLQGARSGLFYEALRIIRAARPSVFIFENVQGLLSAHGGADFATILRAIADLGLYGCEWQLLNTRWFLPQNRERVYFVGHLRGQSRPCVFPLGTEIGHGDPLGYGRETRDRQGIEQGNRRRASRMIRIAARRRLYADKVGSLRGRLMPGQMIVSPYGCAPAIVISTNDTVIDPFNVVDHSAGALRKRRMALRGEPEDVIRRRMRSLTPVEMERLQGFPDGWTEFGVDGHGNEVVIPRSARWHAMGNAVSVPVVREIGRRLLSSD